MRRIAIIFGLLTMLLLTGCESDDVMSGISETIDTLPEEQETDTDEKPEYIFDWEVTEKKENDPDDEQEQTDRSSPYKGPDDFYINVTDCNGDEKTIFYMCGDEENDTSVYMQDKMDDPESHFGYISVLSQDLPAKTDSAFFGEELKKFADQAYMGYAAISYFYADNGFSSSSQTVDVNTDPEKFEKLMDAICSFEPEFVPELMEEQSGEGNSAVNSTVHVYDSTVNGNYDMRYPLSSLNIYPGNIEHYPNITTATMASLHSVPSINFSFSRYGSKAIGRMRVYDYREIQKLTLSKKQPPSPEELEKAYYESTYYISDWFYIDDTEFYDCALKYVLLSDDNEFPGIKQKSTFDGYDSQAGFSENIAAHLNTSGKIPDGYETAQFRNIYFVIPKDGKIMMNGDAMFMWENNDDAEIVFRVSKTVSGGSRSETIVSEVGKYNNEYSRYRSLYDETQHYYWDEVSFHDTEGNNWIAAFKLNSDKRTDEYDTMVKNVLGSISLYAPGEQREDVKIKLASEPSVYADSSELAGSNSDRGNSYIAYYPDMMLVTFYALDWNNNYDTGFECYLEKREADGQWYRVEPLGGGITQVNNGSGHFYNVFESGRQHVTFDLAAYPLLPPGYYRIVKPFWEEGSDDHHQYAAFFEFKMSEVAGYGSGITASAKCGQDTYPSNVREITYTVEVDGNSFVISDIADIERLENGEWVSVRTKPLRLNSIGGSYSLRFSGMEETIDTGSFDLSEPGEYRIRISVGAYDYETDENMFVDNYDTVYAYFKISL